MPASAGMTQFRWWAFRLSYTVEIWLILPDATQTTSLRPLARLPAGSLLHPGSRPRPARRLDARAAGPLPRLAGPDRLRRQGRGQARHGAGDRLSLAPPGRRG